MEFIEKTKYIGKKLAIRTIECYMFFYKK